MTLIRHLRFFAIVLLSLAFVHVGAVGFEDDYDYVIDRWGGKDGLPSGRCQRA